MTWKEGWGDDNVFFSWRGGGGFGGVVLKDHFLHCLRAFYATKIFGI